jgi:hypothetical protein
VVSFWKPEVAIRLVNDFTEYPYSHGECDVEVCGAVCIACRGERRGDWLTDYCTCTISIPPVPHAIDRDVVYKVKGQPQRSDRRVQHSSSYERQGFYRPAVFVDEIGLTSDKYVVLNETVQELPLKISFGPLSLQVRKGGQCSGDSAMILVVT